MADYHYPSIPKDIAAQFALMLQIAKDKPDYFTDPACPYEPAVIEALVYWTELKKEAAKPAPPPEPVTNEDKWTVLERETRSLFNELTTASKDITAADTAERMSYFRTATSLLDKLVSLQERAVGLKQMSDFQNTIIMYLDEIATPDQRTLLMERIAKVHVSDGASHVTENKSLGKTQRQAVDSSAES